MKIRVKIRDTSEMMIKKSKNKNTNKIKTNVE